MDVKIKETEKEIKIGGFCAETTLEKSEKDLEELFNDFYNGKMDLLNNFSKNKTEYYGLIWYTKLHESYIYLIGQDITKILSTFITVPAGYKNMLWQKLIHTSFKIKDTGFKIKEIPKGIYAYSSFTKDIDPIKAWTDFYKTGIPETGYRPKEEDDFAYEYYPNGLHGDYELWSLVEKNI